MFRPLGQLLCFLTTMCRHMIVTSDVEDNTRSNLEFLPNLTIEFNDRALLANQRRKGHFKKDCPYNKTSSPSYTSASRFQLKLNISFTPNHQNKDFDVPHNKNKDKGLVAESYDYDEEKLSLGDDDYIHMKAFMAFS
ncbi:hypothetical protein Tco_0888253 [Tanacetum coccineum]